MSRILTITLNPTIDKSTSVEKIEPDSKLRCSAIKNEPGGGGINVSKALQELNCDALALFPTGGNNGEVLKSLLEKEKVKFHAIPVEQETRENFMVIETSTKKQFRFIMPGEKTDQNLLQQVLDFISKSQYEFIIASGSIAPGLPEDAYAQIGVASKKTGAKFILDTSGPALKAAVEKNLFMIKPNIGELAKLSKIEWLENDKVEAAARKLIEKGWAEIVAVSMGKDGALLVTKAQTYSTKAPEVEKKSTVGAGDSMVAGMVYMLSQNKPLDQALKFGVACGTAATMNEGTELFHKDDAESLFKKLNES